MKRSHDAPKRDVAGSYPGGKAGAGVYQRLINLIPRHQILISAFAGHCAVVRHIKPAERTIVIDKDPDVCQWWDDWRRTKQGRNLEVINADSIDWISKMFPARSDLRRYGKVFLFCDPPYVLSERSHGKTYACEMTDQDHVRLLEGLTQIPATAANVMLCGYQCKLYRRLKRWRSIDHQVPTRGGLQSERIWLNYQDTDQLHDFRFIGDTRRQRERIRRRQRNWASQLSAMHPREQAAMMNALNAALLSSMKDQSK